MNLRGTVILVFITFSAFSQNKRRLNTELDSLEVLKRQTILDIETVRDSLLNISQKEYNSLLEKTNEQLGLINVEHTFLINTLGVLFGALGVMFAILAIVFGFYLYRQEEAFKRERREALEDIRETLNFEVRKTHQLLEQKLLDLDGKISERLEHSKNLSTEERIKEEQEIEKLKTQQESIKDSLSRKINDSVSYQIDCNKCGKEFHQMAYDDPQPYDPFICTKCRRINDYKDLKIKRTIVG